jgi:hypothetical protein
MQLIFLIFSSVRLYLVTFVSFVTSLSLFVAVVLIYLYINNLMSFHEPTLIVDVSILSVSVSCQSQANSKKYTTLFPRILFKHFIQDET